MEELMVKQQELKEKMADLLNSYGLPAFIIEPVLKDFYQQVVARAEQQYLLAKKRQEKENKKQGGRKDAKK